jgi:hypothetical protein
MNFEKKIFRVVTKKIGGWGNWKHKYGKYFFFVNQKKKHLGFLKQIINK